MKLESDYSNFCKFLQITNTRKKDSTSSPNKFQGIETVYMLQILDASVKYKKNPKLFWGYKKNPHGGLEWDKGRFNVLRFTNSDISFTLPPSI